MNVIKDMPQERYINALLGCKPYAVIDDTDRELIVSGGAVCMSELVTMTPHGVIENEVNMRGMNNEPLTQLRTGLWRLWTVRDWELCDNKRQEAVKRIDAALSEARRRRQCIVRSMMTKGVTEDAATRVINDMPDSVIATMYSLLTVEETQ